MSVLASPPAARSTKRWPCNELDVPVPDVLITAAGTELHYGTHLLPDRSWERQIRYRWDREEVARVVGAIPGLHPVEHPTDDLHLVG